MSLSFVEYAKKRLVETKNKLTQSRLRILELLANSTQPLSPYDVQKEDASLDVVSIYRAFELFESMGLIHKIRSLGGYVVCDLDQCDHVCCHEFRVCKQCKTFTEHHAHHAHTVNTDGFTTYSHISEQVGLCATCSLRVL